MNNEIHWFCIEGSVDRRIFKCLTVYERAGLVLPVHFTAQHMAPSYKSHVGPSIFGHPCVFLDFLN